MKLALNESGQRIEATPGSRGQCPSCRSEVIAKCGELKIWHWAHVAADCDPWTEPETPWHRSWKALFPVDQTEVVIGPHRADAVTSRNTVIEFQHSPLPVGEIHEREAFYGRMAWVVDAEPFLENLTFRGKGKHWSMDWKWPRLGWAQAKAPVYLDLHDGNVFRFHWMRTAAPGRAKGTFGTVQELVEAWQDDFSGWCPDLCLKYTAALRTAPIEELLKTKTCLKCERHGALTPPPGWLGFARVCVFCCATFCVVYDRKRPFPLPVVAVGLRPATLEEVNQVRRWMPDARMAEL